MYIGQRVRIKWSLRWPELDGTEGTIVSGLTRSVSSLDNKIYDGYNVCPDKWGTCKAPSGNNFQPSPEQLEPIQPSGWEKITWEECKVWSPGLGALTPGNIEEKV